MPRRDNRILKRCELTAQALVILAELVEVALQFGYVEGCLAGLLRYTNGRDEARAMLAEIYNWFTEGFDTPDLKDAKALLDELSDP